MEVVVHEAIPNMRSINLNPFHYDMENSVHFRKVLYNVIVFIPAGFYFTEFLKKKVCGLELLQLYW